MAWCESPARRRPPSWTRSSGLERSGTRASPTPCGRSPAGPVRKRGLLRKHVFSYGSSYMFSQKMKHIRRFAEIFAKLSENIQKYPKPKRLFILQFIRSFASSIGDTLILAMKGGRWTGDISSPRGIPTSTGQSRSGSTRRSPLRIRMRRSFFSL